MVMGVCPPCSPAPEREPTVAGSCDHRHAGPTVPLVEEVGGQDGDAVLEHRVTPGPRGRRRTAHIRIFGSTWVRIEAKRSAFWAPWGRARSKGHCCDDVVTEIREPDRDRGRGIGNGDQVLVRIVTLMLMLVVPVGGVNL